MLKIAVRDPIYRICMTLFIDVQKKRVNRLYGTKFTEYEGSDGECWYERETNKGIVMWMRYHPNHSLFTKVFIHELVHAVRMGFEHVGIEYRAENDECIAYLMEYFYHEFDKKIKQSEKSGYLKKRYGELAKPE